MPPFDSSEALDRRLNAVRPDLADSALRDRVSATRFVDPKPATVHAPVAPLRQAPRPSSALDTELLFGETVRVFERRDGWAWVQSDIDGYVGYTPTQALTSDQAPDRTGEVAPASHAVRALRAFVFPIPSMKAPPLMTLSFEARVAIIGTQDGFSEIAGVGFLYSDLLRRIDEPLSDPVDAALRFLNTPYLWGGRSGFGVDCSGFVQLAWAACGVRLPRDTDMQLAALSEAVPFDGDESVLRRGDLVFWDGHIGIWIDEDRFLHANAGDMTTALAPLAPTARRIEAQGDGPITAVRRPPLSAVHSTPLSD
ncbi:MAG: NlpC/P60 family protein [Alphaproteobacteria bacterium]|nr:NlpC/P60 family protein [Alphaproteobacteria bacterium]